MAMALSLPSISTIIVNRASNERSAIVHLPLLVYHFLYSEQKLPYFLYLSFLIFRFYRPQVLEVRNYIR